MRAELPTLGSCLGYQLPARAAGLTVRLGTVDELGWAPLRNVDRDDPFASPRQADA